MSNMFIEVQASRINVNLRKILLAALAFIVFAASIHFYLESLSEMIVISNDPDFLSGESWNVGFYSADATSYYVYHNDVYAFHVVDFTGDDKLGWGFAHQGLLPHGWGLAPPLNFMVEVNPRCPGRLILEIKLKRSKVTWLNGSIPHWLSRYGFRGHCQIGLMLCFEIPGRNYNASTIVADSNFQFEVTFLRCRLKFDGGVAFLGDDYPFWTPEYDNDTHVLFSITQISSGKWNEIKIDLTLYLWRAWKAVSNRFGDVGYVRLRWINFYIEVLNAQIDVEVDYIKLIYKPRPKIACGL